MQMILPGLEETTQENTGRGQWPIVKLGDVCQIISGSTPKREKPEYWDGDIPWVTPKDLSNLPTMYLHSVPEYITEAGYKSCSTSMLPMNSVLFSSRAPIGHVAINKIPVCTNQGFKSFVPDKSLEPEWLAYWLKGKKEYLQSLGNGATFKEISKSTIEEVEIPLPPLSEQQRIVARLDQAQRLIDQRKEQLALMDALVQSLFYELFGDPVKNEKGWERCKLEELFSIISDCPHSTPNYLNDKIGYPCIRTSDIQAGFLDFKSTKHVDFNEYSNRVKRYVPKANDIIYSREGERFGLAAKVPNGMQLCLGQRVMIFSVENNLAISSFAWALLNSKYIYNQALLSVGGATSPHVNIKDIKKFDAVLPPLPLQQTFADRVQQIEALKQQMQVSLAELEQNFQALMQEAFGT